MRWREEEGKRGRERKKRKGTLKRWRCAAEVRERESGRWKERSGVGGCTELVDNDLLIVHVYSYGYFV